MRKLAYSILLVSTATTTTTSNTAFADSKRFEVGVALGGHAFAEDAELGAGDNAMDPGPVSSGLLGLRIGLPLSRRLAVEAEASWIPTEDDVLGDEATVWGLGAHMRFDLLTGKVKPFLVAGFGGHILRSSSPQMDDDADKAAHWGAGLRYAVRDALDLRLDARHLIVPARSTNGATSDFEVSAGVTYRFGGKKAAAPMPRPLPPPAPAVVKIAPPPAPLPAVVEAPKPVIEELAGIGFERHSAKIDVQSTSLLDAAYALLEKNPKLTVEVSGHTSSDGDPDHNLELSIARAEAVKAYLVKRGIDASRVLTVGHGSEKPVADNATEEGRRMNRRIEFRILTQP